MRGPELPLFVLVLILCQVSRGPAAPVPEGGGTVLSKMYPRGNHWAVGHLMGKKSTEETPYVFKADRLKQYLEKYSPWVEAARNALDILEVEEDRSHQPAQQKPLDNRQLIWDTEERMYFRNWVDSLLKLLKEKEEASS